VGSVRKSANVPYTAEQMYDLVNDIETYPEFLPRCTGAKVFDRKDDSLTATVFLSSGKIKQTFTTEFDAGWRTD
jgi:ribosome-associated toxin RatA of RatAB toxin-antitoxin module